MGAASFLPLIIGVSQGLLHALGPDHCAALLTLGQTGEKRRRTVVAIALRFAVGHAIVLGGMAAVCLLLGAGLSEAFERWAEIGGGLILVALSVAALLFPNALRHGHPHVHLGEVGQHTHLRAAVPLAAGALMAFSGVRSILLALPPLLVGGTHSPLAWSYVPGFALGVMAGMSAVGLLFAEGVHRLGERASGWVQRGSAVMAGLVGVFWIAVRV